MLAFRFHCTSSQRTVACHDHGSLYTN